MTTRRMTTRRRLAVGTALALFAATLAVLGSVSPAAAAGLVVTTAADVVADDGVCSLREAVEAANTDTASGASAGECVAGSGADVITFGVAGPVVVGGSPGLVIISEVTVDGGADGIVIDAATELTICGGGFCTAGDAGDATLEEVTITGSWIINVGGTLVVSRSAITGTAGYGLWTTGDSFRTATTTVVNSTVSGNGSAGLLFTVGGVGTVDSSTITGNGGAGIVMSGGTTTTVASIVAGNTGDDVSGAGLSSGGYNVIGDGAVGAFTGPGDVTGVVDPGLGPLGDNGGPTHTHALLPGSPAIDRVTAAVGSDPATDQRGIARPQGTAKDAGAFERDRVVLLPTGFGTAEGQSGSQIFEIPISLSRPSTEAITVDYVSWPCEIFDGCGDGLATEGVDYESPAPGTLTFQPGEMTKTVPVVVYGDEDPEPVYLFGEWFLIRFLNPSPNAVLDPSFFGLGAGVIGNDDTAP